MEHKHRIVFCMLLALFLKATMQAVSVQSVSTQAQVVINEVMAQNNSTIVDPDYGESAVCIELYNGGSEDVDLGGYFVTFCSV